ncbi:MAG: ParA family protein [Candidatus Omnitrophica bacterium]|nr:ParA family protein [Candidatus Omnitrophota bacterium]
MLETKQENGSTVIKKKSWLGLRGIFSGIPGLSQNGHSDLESKQERLPVHLRPVAISVMNQKGGCGKTTTAVNLSAALAMKGFRVLVVDMDPQAHASLGFGITVEEFRRSVYDLLVDPDAKFGDVMRSTNISGLEVLPSSIRLSSAQLDLANVTRGETALKRSLRHVDKEYDFIMIDCPPTLNLLTLNTLAYASKVLIPVQTHYYALEGMKELFKTIEAVRNRFNPNLEILGILATLYDRRIGVASEMLEALRDYFKSQMFQTVINSSAKLVETPMVHEPVISYAPKSGAAGDFNRLAAEVIHLVTKEN